jgi:hypothetical protein
MSALGQSATYALHQIAAYSITSSARASRPAGTLMPSAFAGEGRHGSITPSRGQVRSRNDIASVR